MRLPFFSPKIEHLDLYLAKKAYDKALAAIDGELARNPGNSLLRRRQADILRRSGDGERALEVLRSLAREYAEEGFHTRAVTLYKEVLTCTRLRSYQQGNIIVTEGEEGSSLFVLVDGEVKVFTRGSRGEHIRLAELGAGDLFGEVSVLHGKPRTATITASAWTTAIEIDKADIDRIASQHPKVREVLQRFCEERAQNAIERLIGAPKSA